MTLALIIFIVIAKNTAYAGEACVFFDPTIFFGLVGHVAWGWEVDDSATYVFGSDDGPNNGNICGGPKIWSQTNGTRSDMLNWFKNRNYSSYNCQPVSNSAVGSANTAITTVKSQPYYWASIPCLKTSSTNCLDDVMAILNAYNATGLPSTSILSHGAPDPRTWFGELGTSGNSNGGKWLTSSQNL
ncbi:21597_t:CDS:1 [Gigaspora margarita]|uniref:21597_t:CDS:1 n=1 Tax=Gigaspora margarita TaxID=4874 RepID=A0ABN7VYF1_GIGMA|nr:21597_t:CDS:1 [Gigaspora margarita]